MKVKICAPLIYMLFFVQFIVYLFILKYTANEQRIKWTVFHSPELYKRILLQILMSEQLC